MPQVHAAALRQRCSHIVGCMIERGKADAHDTSSDLERKGLRLAAGFRHLNIVKRLQG